MPDIIAKHNRPVFISLSPDIHLLEDAVKRT